MFRLLPLLASFFMASTCMGDSAVAVGKMAPDFELKGSDGKSYKLSDFKDKEAVVIAWYPKAFTGG